MSERSIERKEYPFGDTLREAYAYGTEFLKEVPDGSLDARILLTEAASLSLSAFLAEKERLLTDEEKDCYLQYLTGRGKRKPVAYILGKQDFFGRTFLVTEDVLIPNQDTETLVEAVLPVLQEKDRILDLCTGSGCILLSLLSEKKNTTGVGTDLSEAALSVAKKNAALLSLNDRASFLQGDLYEALSLAEENEKDVFDVIVSNPPYIRAEVIETLEEEVKTYEPRLALDGGEDGLRFYKAIIGKAKEHLKQDGHLFLEIGFDQREDVKALLFKNGFSDIEVYKDLNGSDRVIMATQAMAIDSERTDNV